MLRKKVLTILSVSVGTGHVRAAEALKLTAQNLYPHIETIHLDVMDLVSKLFRKMYADSYIKIIDRHPSLWGYLYETTNKFDDESTITKIREAIERLNIKNLKKKIRELNPDYIICTHFLPAQLLSRMIRKGKLDCPVWLQVTDYDIHALWVHQHMTGYIAACDEVAWRMADRGIDPSSIHVAGIPISPAFNQPLDRRVCAGELGIRPDMMTFLMVSGGAGVGGLEYIVDNLLSRIEGNFQLITIAGKNKELLQKLKELALKYSGILFPIGFTKTIERVMTASDMVITKPGGLTISECLALAKPMVLVATTPGQEERNATYLLENGAAMKAYDSAGLEFRVKTILESPELLKRMSMSAKNLGKPYAARDVLRIVLGETEQGDSGVQRNE